MNDRERLNDVQCILADDLKELIAKYYEKMYPSSNHLLAMQLAFYLADHGVTVQKHGRWEFVDDYTGKCTNCHEENIMDWECEDNYCPNCGAKMDKEET